MCVFLRVCVHRKHFPGLNSPTKTPTKMQRVKRGGARPRSDRNKRLFTTVIPRVMTSFMLIVHAHCASIYPGRMYAECLPAMCRRTRTHRIHSQLARLSGVGRWTVAWLEGQGSNSDKRIDLIRVNSSLPVCAVSRSLSLSQSHGLSLSVTTSDNDPPGPAGPNNPSNGPGRRHNDSPSRKNSPNTHAPH